MIPEEVRDLLEQRNNAIAGIKRAAGGPQLSPVWYLWDGEAFYFRIGTNTAKYRNLVRDAAISLMVMDSAGFRYLTAYGQAQILDNNPADIAAAIVEKYYAPQMAPHKMPPDMEPDVVTICLRPDKVVAIVEDIAREAVESWS